MRIHFDSLTLPKKAARRIQKHFSPEFSPGMKLADAQEITASMLGYGSWHELQKATAKCTSPSALDEDVSEAEQKARIDYQTDVLCSVTPLINIVVRQIALKFRVSARNPNSPTLTENGNQCGFLKCWKDPYSGQEEWRFFGSNRSNDIDVHEVMWDLQEQWDQAQLTYGEFKDKVQKILSKQPENLTAWWLLLRAANDVGALHLCSQDIRSCEKQIRATIPPNFPTRKKVSMEWGTIENRDFLRCAVSLAECFYKTGKHSKAKRWFNFADKTTNQFTDYCRPYLKDLRLKRPTGRVHEMDESEVAILLSGVEAEIEQLRQN